MKTNEAVIYCRVASAPAGHEREAIEGQAKRCRSYAAARGYEVVAEFADHGSGMTVDRPGIHELLAFTREGGRGLRVLVDGVERIARGIDGYTAVVSTLARAGAALEDVSGERP